MAVPAAALAQTPTPERKVTLTGKLLGGKVAVGGETSGWELTYRDKTGDHSIELELTKAQLAKVRDGQQVRVTGTIVTRERLERGNVPTLVVATIEPTRPK